jgi:VWFA-related protein
MLSLGNRFASSLVIAATLVAAVDMPAKAQAQANTPASNLPATRIKVTSNLVVVRVVVRDAQGKPVKGLRKEDFRLFDSGKEQAITQFEVEAAVEPASPPPVAAHKPQQPAATLSSALPRRFLALYFDELYASDSDIIQVRQAADAYLAANLQPADRVAIFTPGEMLSDFTSDPRQIHEAVSKLKAGSRDLNPGSDCPRLSDYQALEITRSRAPLLEGPPEPIILRNDAWGLAYEEALARNCLPSFNPVANTNYILGRASEVVGQAEVLTRSNLRELEEVVKYTAQMPGQRTVILGSPGFLLQDDNQFQLERIIDQALRLQVVISSLDPRGLFIVARQVDASRMYMPGRSGVSSGAMHRMDQNREVLATDVLAQVAEGTGGEYFHNSNDLKGGFARLAGSPGAYILAFAPQDLKPDGKLHPLKVTLAEKGYSIQARRSYFAPRNEAEANAWAKEAEAPGASGQLQEQIREALLSKTDVAQFPVALDTKLAEGQGETHELSLSSQVDPKSLNLQKESSRNLDTLTFVFGVFDQKEKLVTAEQRHATVDVTDEQLPQFLQSGINLGVAFQLKPGAYRIREVVTDSGQRLTTLSRNVDIPKIIPPTPVPPVELASSVPPILPVPTPQPQLVPRPVSDPATDELLRRVWSNFVGYLSSIPNVFADEHVISSVTTPYNPSTRNGFHDNEIDSTTDSTIDSTFGLKRISTDGKTADLIESREVKAVDHHTPPKGQTLAGPAILVGAFSRAPNVFSPDVRDCYDYRLLSNARHKPGQSALFAHSDLLVLEYVLRSPRPAGVSCPVSEPTMGRAFIDPSSMQIVRLEQQKPRHDQGSGHMVDWSWSIDYARVTMNGKYFWLPKTISSKASSLDGAHFKWSFLANYSNYHLMTVTSSIVPAANGAQH